MVPLVRWQLYLKWIRFMEMGNIGAELKSLILGMPLLKMFLRRGAEKWDDS